MATACIARVTFGFEPKGKPVVARFDTSLSSERSAGEWVVTLAKERSACSFTRVGPR